MGRLPKTENLLLNGPAGKLQSVLETPGDGVIRGCAVVCHPHPQQGGTLQNKVVHTLARAFVNKGIAALRFNFRGTGSSEGVYDEGNGELQDALAAATWLSRRMPGLPMWLAGFSFGAAIAIRAAMDIRPSGLVSIAPAAARFAAGLERQPTCPWLIIQGDDDELVAADETISWVNSLEPGPELQMFADTGHFFHGRLVKLRDAVEAFIERNQSVQ